jgi:hypothetical protein
MLSAHAALLAKRVEELTPHLLPQGKAVGGCMGGMGGEVSMRVGRGIPREFMHALQPRSLPPRPSRGCLCMVLAVQCGGKGAARACHWVEHHNSPVSQEIHARCKVPTPAACATRASA